MGRYLVIIFYLLSLSLHSQYRKMPLDTNHYWNEFCTWVYTNPDSYYNCQYQYNVSKDTLIGGRVYQKIIRTNLSCNSKNHIGGFAKSFLRQDTVTRKVFVLDNNLQERILYNFQKNVGDTALLYDRGMDAAYVYTVTSIDSLLLNDGNYHRRHNYNLTYFGPSQVVEGVGGYRGLITPHYVAYGSGYYLICMGKKYPFPSTIYHQSGNNYSCDILLGEKNQIAIVTILVFPNPFSNNIFIAGDKSEQITSIKVYDLLGKEIPIDNTKKSEIHFETENLSPGIYFLHINANGSSAVQKIIKE